MFLIVVRKTKKIAKIGSVQNLRRQYYQA